MRRAWAIAMVVACRGSSPQPSPPPPTGSSGSAVAAPADAAVAVGERHTISAGNRHACARTADGHVACWGELAHPSTILRGNRFFAADNPAKPAVVAGLDHVSGVLAGDGIQCAWRDAGDAWCWGMLDSHAPRTPAAIPHVTGVIQVSGGWSAHMLCALLADGHVTCWGDPTWSADPPAQRGEWLVAPKEVHVVPELADAVEIAVGDNQACARRRGGVVACWETPAPAHVVPVGAAFGAIGLDGNGANGFAALLPGGKVAAWTLPGQKPEAVPVQLPADATMIAYGSLVCVAGARVTCWTPGADQAAVIDGIAGPIRDLAAGDHVACARGADGARCWGDQGLLGDGSTTQAIAAVEVAGLANVTAIATADRTTCAVSTGHVWCWGRRLNYKPKNDYDEQIDVAPVEVPKVDTAIAISVDGQQACATLATKQTVCWGYDGKGYALEPKRGQAHGGSGFGGGFGRESWSCDATAKDVQCRYTFQERHGGGESHWPEQGYEIHKDGMAVAGIPSESGLCVLRHAGTVECGGTGVDFVEVPGIDDGIAIGHGPNFGICVLKKTGGVACWPEELRRANEGPGPAPVEGVTDATALVTGPDHACVLRRGGTVACWGAWNLVGAGRTPASPRAVPVAL